MNLSKEKSTTSCNDFEQESSVETKKMDQIKQYYKYDFEQEKINHVLHNAYTETKELLNKKKKNKTEKRVRERPTMENKNGE